MTFSFKQYFSLGVVLGVALLGASLLSAWTGPTATAPSGNVAAPINVGTTDQVKDAGLSLNGLAVFGSAYIQDKLGIGTTTPVVALDVEGTIKVGDGNELCQGISAGAIRFNNASDVMEYCDGTAWTVFGGGAGSGAPAVQTYSAAGTYSFTVPSSFDNLIVIVKGAGGGGGDRYCTARAGCLFTYTGTTGGQSNFTDSVIGYGGVGGSGASAGANGSATGGDVNTVGAGGHGATESSGSGGEGGQAVKAYTAASLTPGSSVSVTVGAGGTGSGSYTTWSYRANGSDGSVTILWQ